MIGYIFIISALFFTSQKYVQCEVNTGYDFLPSKQEGETIQGAPIKCIPDRKKNVPYSVVIVTPTHFKDADLFKKFDNFVKNRDNAAIEKQLYEHSLQMAYIADKLSAHPTKCYEHYGFGNPTTFTNKSLPEIRTNVLHNGTFKSTIINQSYHFERILGCSQDMNFKNHCKGRRTIVVILVDKPPHVLRHYIPGAKANAASFVDLINKNSLSVLYITSKDVYYDYAFLLHEMNIERAGLRKIGKKSLVSDIVEGILNLKCILNRSYRQSSTSYYYSPFSYDVPLHDFGQLELGISEVVITIDQVSELQLYPKYQSYLNDLRQKRVILHLMDMLARRYPFVTFIMYKGLVLNQPNFEKIALSNISKHYSYQQTVPSPAKKKANICAGKESEDSNLFHTNTIFYRYGREFPTTVGRYAWGKKRIGIHIVITHDFPAVKHKNITGFELDTYMQVMKQAKDYVIYLTDNLCSYYNNFNKYDYDVVKHGRNSLETVGSIMKKIDDRLKLAEQAEKYNYKQSPIRGFIQFRTNPDNGGLRVFFLIPVKPIPQVFKIVQNLFNFKFKGVKHITRDIPPNKFKFGFGFYGDSSLNDTTLCETKYDFSPSVTLPEYDWNAGSKYSNISGDTVYDGAWKRSLECAKHLSEAGVVPAVIIAFVQAEQVFHKVPPFPVNANISAGKRIALTVIKAGDLSEDIDIAFSTSWGNTHYFSQIIGATSHTYRAVHNAISFHYNQFYK